MDSDVVVGVDFGSSRIKAAAYRRSGEMVALRTVETPVVRRDDGDDFPVLAVLTAAHGVIAALDAGPIAALGTTSMGEVGTVLTEDGLADLVFPAWYDERGAAVARRLEHEFGARRLRDLTGRHLRTASTVAKLAHAHAESPTPPGVFAGLCGALAFQLTGRLWQEGGLAATSGVYDLLARRYATAPWAAAGLGHIELPRVRPAGHSEHAHGWLAASLGLREDAAVVIAGHDHPVASVGAGLRGGEVSDSLGTGEALIAPLTAGDPAPAALAAHLDDDPDLSFEFWPVDGSLLAVWERMRPGLAMRAFLAHSDATRDVLERDAIEQLVGGRDIRPPFSDAALTALEAGLSVESPFDAASWGALIDSYVLLANRGERLIRAVSGATGATVLTGGGLRSGRWREAKARLGPRPLEVSIAREAATRGCAALAGAAIGWWPTPERMPGDIRMPIASLRDMEAAAAALA